MPNMIEPNLHPMIVHFTVAFLLTSTLAFIVIRIAPKDAVWRASLKSAADWMFAFGVLAAIAAVAAGLQAYYTVAHDGPSHAAMTVHRNIAVPTAAAFILLAVWRWTRRKEFPATLFSLLMLVAAGGLATTAWWGGRLVYGHGLGVKSMPMVTGEGHDHEHAPGEGHNAAAPKESDHDHGEGAQNDHAHGDEADNREHEMADGDHAMSPAPAVNATSPEAVVDAFAAALRSGDEAAVRTLFLPDVLIAEGGGAERSLEEYAGHHMPADMAYVAAVDRTIKNRDVIAGDSFAAIITEAQIHGVYEGKTVHSRLMETMVLQRIGDQWRIAHIHWSSAPITGEHEH